MQSIDIEPEKSSLMPTPVTKSPKAKCRFKDFLETLVNSSDDDSELEIIVNKCNVVFSFLCAILSVPQLLIGKHLNLIK